MNKCFIDTNIFIYAYIEQENWKTKKSIDFLNSIVKENKPFISTQVICEISNFLYKNKVNHKKINQIIDEVSNTSNILIITFSIIKKAIQISEKYQISWWDSLLLATALEYNCYTFYSEDLNSNQIIENKLKIVNPLIID